jgi:hypothetical protein
VTGPRSAGSPEEGLTPSAHRPAWRFAISVAPGGGPARLHEPRRVLLALSELVLAVLAVLLAAWCWGRGIVVIDLAAPDGTPALRSTRYLGSWMSTAVALGTVTGLLLLDASRQLVLGLRARRRNAAG